MFSILFSCLEEGLVKCPHYPEICTEFPINPPCHSSGGCVLWERWYSYWSIFWDSLRHFFIDPPSRSIGVVYSERGGILTWDLRLRRWLTDSFPLTLFRWLWMCTLREAVLRDLWPKQIETNCALIFISISAGRRLFYKNLNFNSASTKRETALKRTQLADTSILVN